MLTCAEYARKALHFGIGFKHLAARSECGHTRTDILADFTNLQNGQRLAGSFTLGRWSRQKTRRAPKIIFFISRKDFKQSRSG